MAMSIAPVARKGQPGPFKSYARIPRVLEVPNLIQMQLDSFLGLQGNGIRELLDEVSPIEDFTGNRFELRFLGQEFKEPRHKARGKTISFELSVGY